MKKLKLRDLETERLNLTGLSERDKEGFHALKSDPEGRAAYFAKPLTAEESERQLFELKAANLSLESLTWALRLKADDLFIGTVVLWNLNQKPGQAELGYELLREYQGQGFAGEALEAVVNEAFYALGFSRVIAFPGEENWPSRKLLERHAFRHAGSVEMEGHRMTIYLRRRLACAG